MNLTHVRGQLVEGGGLLFRGFLRVLTGLGRGLGVLSLLLPRPGHLFSVSETGDSWGAWCGIRSSIQFCNSVGRNRFPWIYLQYVKPSEDTFGHNLESQSKEQLNAITTYTWQVLTRVWQGNQSHCLSCPPRTPLTVRTRSPPRTPPVHCPCSWASVSSFWNVLLMSLQGTKKVLFLIIGKKSINIHSESISAWSPSFSLSGKILKYTFHFAAQLSRSGLQVTHNEEQINAIINLHVQVSTRYGGKTVNEVWEGMAL